LFVCDSTLLPNTILGIDEVNTNIGTNVKLEGQVHVNDREAGKSFALTGAMIGIGGLVGKTIAKAPMPPLQKAGAVVIGAVVGGVTQKVIDNWSGNVGASSTSSTTSSLGGTISKLVDDSQVSLLQNTLFQFNIVYLGCLYLVLLLIIQLVFKLYFKDNVTLNLSKLLGKSLNNKLEYYLNKIINLNKKMSVF
jgi:hypothetical protein